MITQYITSLKSLSTRNWDIIEAAMKEIYADNVEFKDPLFHKYTLKDLLNLYKKMISGAKEIHVNIIENESPHEITLTLEYTSKIGLKFIIQGAKTIIKFENDKIIKRQDKWGIRNLRLKLAF